MNASPVTIPVDPHRAPDPVEEYLKSMEPKNYLAYTIAKEHLGTSFTVEKSVGYLRWLSQRKPDPPPTPAS